MLSVTYKKPIIIHWCLFGIYAALVMAGYYLSFSSTVDMTSLKYNNVLNTSLSWLIVCMATSGLVIIHAFKQYEKIGMILILLAGLTVAWFLGLSMVLWLVSNMRLLFTLTLVITHIIIDFFLTSKVEPFLNQYPTITMSRAPLDERELNTLQFYTAKAYHFGFWIMAIIGVLLLANSEWSSQYSPVGGLIYAFSGGLDEYFIFAMMFSALQVYAIVPKFLAWSNQQQHPDPDHISIQ
ncbi:MAG: hypothetical protein VXY77_04925 [Pseudomonadota bacterium]|nr:hypothetical protein [Pseudomonadota bacterium]